MHIYFFHVCVNYLNVYKSTYARLFNLKYFRSFSLYLSITVKKNKQ